MSGVSASGLFRQNAIVVGLCLLAVLFAVEAKLAWYSPVGGPSSDVRSAKAFRPDMPEVVQRSVSSPDSAHPLIAFALLATFGIASAIHIDLLLDRNRDCNPQQTYLAAFSATNLFFRPPPAL